MDQISVCPPGSGICHFHTHFIGQSMPQKVTCLQGEVPHEVLRVMEVLGNECQTVIIKKGTISTIFSLKRKSPLQPTCSHCVVSCREESGSKAHSPVTVFISGFINPNSVTLSVSISPGDFYCSRVISWSSSFVPLVYHSPLCEKLKPHWHKRSLGLPQSVYNCFTYYQEK